MIDNLLAWGSLIGLAAFVGVVGWFVNEPDLWIVVVLGVSMATYDFWVTFRNEKNGDKNSGSSRS